MTPLTPTSIEEIVNDDERLKQEAATIAEGISTVKLNVVEFVEQLGFALTSTSVEMRVNGIKLLSGVLQQLPVDYLHEKQLSFLAEFYADRFKDHHNTIPAIIDGITAIIHMKETNAESVIKLLTNFFQHTSCQSQTRTDRFKLFTIFKYINERYTNVIKIMGVDYVLGLINSIDAERDPRNLDLIFEFMPNFISQYDMFHMAEEMFEIFCCYFPIDFNPSSDDPDTITRDKLADKLANCLVASSSFMEWVVSVALEKLESDLNVAKLDSLDLLQRAVLQFPLTKMSTFFEQIWNILKAHVFPGSDNSEVLYASMQLLRTILEVAAKDKEISEIQQSAVLGVILPHLSDAQQRLFDPAASIALVCVAGDAVYAAPKILNVYLLKLNTLNEAETEQHMKIYANIAQILKLASLKEALTKMLGNNICVELQKLVIGHLKQNITNTHVELQRLGLSVLSEGTLIIAESERALIYMYLLQQVLNETSEWLEEGTQLIERLGALHPIEVQIHYLDECIKRFPTSTAKVQRKMLRSFLPLVRQMAFTQRIMDVLFNSIFKSDNLETCVLSLEALNILLQQEDKYFVVELQHNSNLIDKLINFPERFESANENDTYWQFKEQLSLALSLLMQHLDIAEQYLIVTQYFNELKFEAYVTYGLLCKLHIDISLDDYFEKLLSHILLTIALNNKTPKRLRQISLQLLCILVNKTAINTTSWSVVLKYLKQLVEKVKYSEEDIEAIAWFAKALIVRGANESEEIVEKLVALLRDAQTAKSGVNAFEIITTEYKQVQLPNVKFLYKQKFCQLFMQKIGNNLASLSDDSIHVYMQVLKITPHAVLRLNIERIGAVILEALTINHHMNTQLASLEICRSLVAEKDKYIADHVDAFIQNCLKLSCHASSMYVRIAALNLLEDLTKYPIYLLLPHKEGTVYQLVTPLDDAKRLVRRAAVEARNAWILIDTP